MPRTHFANFNLSNKTLAEAELIIDEKIQSFQAQEVDFILDGQNFKSDLASLGITIDREATLNEIRTENRNNLTRSTIYKVKQVAPKYSFDAQRFLQQFDVLFGQFETQAQDATIVWRGGKFQIEEERRGTLINRNQLINHVRTKIEQLSSDPIEVSKVTAVPAIDKENAKQALERVNLIADQRIILTHDTDRWEIGGQKLINLLKFEQKGLEGGFLAKVVFTISPFEIRSLQTVDSVTKILEVKLDKQNLEAFISQIAKRIDTARVDATIKFEGGRVTEFTPFRDGQKLDTLQTYQLILEQISIENVSVQKDIIIKLPVAVNPAKIANEEINSLGIHELIGRGVSYFAGSIPNRIHNVTLGAKRVSGTLVKPGEVFSFNQTVGEVSAATGYKQAYVISQGRTVLDDGGGICQVSTTVFRATLNAGLPTIARVAHAYRVGYYEQAGFKPGFDATVWAPAVDLKFKNDTANYILIQAIVDPAGAKLQVDIYGTADGRRVEIADPVISNLKPPPPDKFQEDPTLPRGTTKQVDFAATGATVVFTRRVFQGDTILIDEAFKSNYRPWQAVYLVGTGG
ncbi:VanW family protein [Candidatus Curtissbacteria bacterium]|nr:VanW family protein [Candidatus Curtissbacteria bacterium]